MLHRPGLVVTKLSAALIVPRTSSTSIFQSKIRIRKVVCSIIDGTDCLHQRPDNFDDLLKSLSFNGLAELGPPSILYLKNKHICPVKHKFSGSQVLGIELTLKMVFVITQALSLGIGDQLLNACRTLTTTFMSRNIDLLVKLPEILNRVYHCTGSDSPDG